MEHPTGAKILIVEDDPAIALLLERVFRMGGYTTTWAPDGLYALELLQVELPDLMTLDMNMPRLNGAQVLARMRATAQFAHIPVIILTSRDELPHQVSMQASAVVTKPFDVVALLAAATSLLGRSPERARTVGS